MSKKAFRDYWRKVLTKGTSALYLALVLLMGLTPGLQAASEPSSPVEVAEVDDGALEVGVWYVQNYENCPGWGLKVLSSTAADVLGLRDKLASRYWLYFPPFFTYSYPTPQWSTPRSWGDGLAWENDWKRTSAGGSDTYEMDSVDLAYFSGHGSASGFFFGVGGNKHSDCILTASDAYWGDTDNDRVGLSACNVLDDPFDNIAKWASVMHGTRLIMGMKTVMADSDFGVPLGDSIRWGNSMTYAWFRAVDQKLPGDQVARILAEDNSYFNDRWYNHTSPTTIDNTFFWWDHSAGQNNLPPSASVASVSGVQQLTRANANGEMPILLVEPLSAAEAQDSYSNIAEAFNLTSTVPQTGTVAAAGIEAINSPNDTFVSPNHDLEMDQSAGNFQYANSAELWNQKDVVRAASAEGMTAVTADDAIAIANAFLQQNNLMPSDAFAPQAQTDKIVTAQLPGRGSATSAAALANEPLTILQEDIANYQVVYSRIVTVTLPAASAAGVDQGPVSAQVVGPGAKLMVYVAPQVPVSATAASILQQDVLGGMGGYRRVQEATVAGTDAPLTTPMLPLETIKTLFNKVEEDVALNYVPLPFDSRQVISDSLSYWEGPIGWEQDQLIPVYILNVRSTNKNGTPAASDDVTQDYDVYIPVNETYMAPYTRIITPTGSILPGDTITLTAADASKTLAQLGVDPSLDFRLGSGETDSYIYNWYTDEISETNKIGSGQSVQFTIPDRVTNGRAGNVKIILTVSDLGSPRASGSTGQDEFTIDFSKTFVPSLHGEAP